jgi:GNAT superfamily N-acetyltransferase
MAWNTAITELRAQRMEFLTASLRGERVGFLAYSIEQFDQHNEEIVMYVYQLQVVKSHQRKGVGRLLIQAAAGIADTRKVVLTCLNVNTDAMAFYESQHFICHEKLSGYAILYVRKLIYF